MDLMVLRMENEHKTWYDELDRIENGVWEKQPAAGFAAVCVSAYNRKGEMLYVQF